MSFAVFSGLCSRADNSISQPTRIVSALRWTGLCRRPSSVGPLFLGFRASPPHLDTERMGNYIQVRDADHRPNLHLVPASTKVLVIHGTLDRMISYSESNYILEGIPHARRVAVGRDYGQVPSEKYGHTWFDYFEPEVWVGVFEGFLDDRVQAQKAQIGPVASGGVKAKL